MPSGKKALQDYRLSAIREDGKNLICVMGSAPRLRLLMSLHGSSLRDANGTRFLAFEASREAALAAESVAEATFTSPEYVALRGELMRPPKAAMDRWLAVEPAAKPGRTPFQHQREFCAFTFSQRGMINGSEQGTCKTMSAAMLVKAWGYTRTLVVCPKTLKLQWQSEFYRSLVDPPTVVPVEGGTAKEKAVVIAEFAGLQEQHVLVVNYEILSDLLPTLLKTWRPQVIIFDESWKIANPRSQMTKAAVAASVVAEKVMLLNGTPIGQDVTQLYSQAALADPMKGEGFESPDEWRETYAKCIDIPRGGYSIHKVVGMKDAPAVVRRISPYFFRATKACLPDLPEKFEPVKVPCELTGPLADFYRLVEKDGDAVFYPTSLSGDRTTTLRLQQVASGYVPHVGSDAGRELLAAMKASRSQPDQPQRLPSPKRDWCCQYANDVLKGNRSYRVIFWLKYTASILELEAELQRLLGNGRVRSVTGATTDKELERIKESFNTKGVEDDDVQAIVAQTAKLAYGANLQGCDWNVLYDHSWRYLERAQLEDRSHRMGRVGPVGYTELIAVLSGKKSGVAQTVDADILKAFEMREDFASLVARDTTGGEL